ncbi:MAG: ABC transporter substrate-binding protein, partial [Acidimicrobiia bacterium]|nr:ABC transporter substrate-binding protein [Acidimicrobiia bacterium]
SEMGLFESDDGDPKVVIEALVDDLNARGGILGRQVEAFVEVYVPISVVDAEATCLRLTEDVNVFAVLGAFAGPTEAADGCFTDLGETIKVGGTPSPEDLERAKAPWYVTSFRDDRSFPAMVDLLDQEGAIVEPLAVVWGPEDQNAAAEVVLPELERLGYEVEVTATQTSDVSDRTALDAEWGTILERLRADGVNTALLVGSSAGINGVNQLTRLGWEGEPVLVSHGLVPSIGGTAEVPLEDLEGVLGTMGATTEEVRALEATQDCVEIFEAAHPDITVVPADEVAAGETDWATPLLGHCLTLRLFEMIATAAGPNLTHETFVAGAESLGEIDLPTIPLASLGPGKIDATDGMRLGSFDPTLGEHGGAAPAGELVRVP